MKLIEVFDNDYRKIVYEFIEYNYGHKFSDDEFYYKIYAVTSKENKLIATSLIRSYNIKKDKTLQEMIHLCCICVDKNMRNQGIGCAFIENLKLIYVGKTITLSVLLDEATLIEYYMKLGAICNNIDDNNKKIELSFIC